MWPWGHLAFGYLLYSLCAHLRGEHTLSGVPVVVLAVGTQLPDLVDKPLAWSFDVFVSGYGAAHSLFLAVPLVLAVGLLARRNRVQESGVAFGVGYLSHLLGDVLFGALFGVADPLGRVFWPVSTPTAYTVDQGFVARFTTYFRAFLAELVDGDVGIYLPLYAVLFTAVLVLWVVDGAPVAREVVGRLRGERRR